jgi:hypothetical protein
VAWAAVPPSARVLVMYDASRLPYAQNVPPALRLLSADNFSATTVGNAAVYDLRTPTAP